MGSVRRKVLLYISNHGLGHAIRAVEVIRKLRELTPNIWVTAVGGKVGWVFSDLLSPPIPFREEPIDSGVAEIDPFSQDPVGSLELYAKVIADKSSIIGREVEFIRKHNIDLVVADIPPLAFDIAEAARISSIGIANFSWDQIYEPFVREYPEYEYVVTDINNSHSRGNLLLQVPFGPRPMGFSDLKEVPLISRVPKEDFSFEAMGVEDERKKILLAFLDPRLAERLCQSIKENEQFFFISFLDLPSADTLTNFVRLDRRHQRDFPPVVRLCDAVLAKLGYGVLTECTSGRTPMVHPPRFGFAEYEPLRTEAAQYIPLVEIPKGKFLDGNWEPYLTQAMASPVPSSTPDLSGATVCANEILDLVES